MHLDYSIHPISKKERRVNLIIYMNRSSRLQPAIAAVYTYYRPEPRLRCRAACFLRLQQRCESPLAPPTHHHSISWKRSPGPLGHERASPQARDPPCSRIVFSDV